MRLRATATASTSQTNRVFDNCGVFTCANLRTHFVVIFMANCCLVHALQQIRCETLSSNVRIIPRSRGISAVFLIVVQAFVSVSTHYLSSCKTILCSSTSALEVSFLTEGITQIRIFSLLTYLLTMPTRLDPTPTPRPCYMHLVH